MRPTPWGMTSAERELAAQDRARVSALIESVEKQATQTAALLGIIESLTDRVETLTTFLCTDPDPEPRNRIQP